MKYFIIIFFFISIFTGYNCQLIKRLEQTAQSTDVVWFKNMVKLMVEQLQKRQLQDMPLSSLASYDDIIGDLLNSSNIVDATCTKMLTPPNSNIIDKLEIEVLKKDGKSYAVQISTNDNNLAVVTRKIATKVKKTA